MNKLHLSIIIPAYNEELSIASTIQTFIENFDKTDIDYEILVINDNSKDTTYNIVKNI